MVVNSIDPLVPYKASDDLILDLVNVTATIKDDPEDAGAAPCRVEIVEPHNLAIHEPPGGFMLANRQVRVLRRVAKMIEARGLIHLGN